MERHRPHALRALNAECRESLAQLVCRLVRECHRQHRPRRGGLKRAEVYHAAALVARRMLGIALQKCKVVLRRPRRHIRAVVPPPVAINVTVAPNEETNAAIGSFADYIKGQVLADSIEIGDNAGRCV